MYNELIWFNNSVVNVWICWHECMQYVEYECIGFCFHILGFLFFARLIGQNSKFDEKKKKTL